MLWSANDTERHSHEATEKLLGKSTRTARRGQKRWAPLTHKGSHILSPGAQLNKNLLFLNQLVGGKMSWIDTRMISRLMRGYGTRNCGH